MGAYIRIDITDHLCEVDDDDLLDEVKERKLEFKPDGLIEAFPYNLIEEAYFELLRGRASEALSILDRLLNPKWRSAKDALSAYEGRLR